MSAEAFAALPDQVQVREVHLLIRQPGFRPKEIILVTTLVNHRVYTKAKLAIALSAALGSGGRFTPCEDDSGHGDASRQVSPDGA